MKAFQGGKLVSYLKSRPGVMVYQTEEHLLIADNMGCFQVESHEPVATLYKPAQMHKNYRTGMNGSYEEHSAVDLSSFWNEHLEIKEAYIVSPTNYLYQENDKRLIRKFTTPKYAEEKCVIWILKPLIDILAALAFELDYHFQFEKLYNSAWTTKQLPVRVSYRKEASENWKVVAFFANWDHQEER